MGVSQTVVDIWESESTQITREQAEKYWPEQRQNMDEGMQFALNASGNASSIGIVGAGRINDFDLAKLVRNPNLKKIDLIDINQNTVEEGINETRKEIEKAQIVQADGSTEKIEKVQNIAMDATLIMKGLKAALREDGESFDDSGKDKYSWLSLGTSQIREIADRITNVIVKVIQDREMPDDLPQNSVTVSDCLLSQLYLAVFSELGNYFFYIFDPDEDSGLSGKEQRSMIKQKQKELNNYLRPQIMKILVKDHINILKQMTLPGGNIFVASDQIKIIPENSHSYQDDQLLHDFPFQVSIGPEKILKNWSWQWNIIPREVLDKNNNSQPLTKSVQGVVIEA